MNASCTLVTAVQTLALPIFTLISSSSNETRGSFDLVRDPSPRRAAWTPAQACPELVERFGVTRTTKTRLTCQRLLPPPLQRRRSEEHRVGKECVRTCSTWCSSEHQKKKTIQRTNDIS